MQSVVMGKYIKPLAQLFGILSYDEHRTPTQKSSLVTVPEKHLSGDEVRQIAEHYGGCIVQRVQTSSPTMAYFARNWSPEEKASAYRQPEKLIAVSVPEENKADFEYVIQSRQKANAKRAELARQHI